MRQKEEAEKGGIQGINEVNASGRHVNQEQAYNNSGCNTSFRYRVKVDAETVRGQWFGGSGPDG